MSATAVSMIFFQRFVSCDFDNAIESQLVTTVNLVKLFSNYFLRMTLRVNFVTVLKLMLHFHSGIKSHDIVIETK